MNEKPAMHLGSIYLVVDDFDKSIAFYEKLLSIPVTFRNLNRFAGFQFEGHCISILNARFDSANAEKVIRKGADINSAADGLLKTADAPNTHKFALNFWVDDLETEHARIKDLNISESLTGICYICVVSPYYYFQLQDPDGNIIEVNGGYTPD